jgi:small subunit ribosomal protein S17
MADDDNTVPEEAPVAPEAEAVSEEPAKPAKRPRAKKAAESAADEAVAEEAGDEAASDESDAPEAKPTRAPRAKKVSEESVSDADETPKKRGPRAKPLKKAARPKERKEHVRELKPVKAEGRRKERRGIVVSAAMDKTITIRIDSAKPHPKYHKIVRRSTRLHVHDERNEAGVGDVVRIVETRPLSKLKRWRMVEIVEKAK